MAGEGGRMLVMCLGLWVMERSSCVLRLKEILERATITRVTQYIASSGSGSISFLRP